MVPYLTRGVFLKLSAELRTALTLISRLLCGRLSNGRIGDARRDVQHLSRRTISPEQECLLLAWQKKGANLDDQGLFEHAHGESAF